MKTYLTAEARTDLRKIAFNIARDKPTRARTFVRELRDIALRIGEAPEAFPLIPRYETRGIRRRPYGNYLIFYKIVRGEVAIVNILPAAMDYEAILFPPNFRTD